MLSDYQYSEIHKADKNIENHMLTNSIYFMVRYSDYYAHYTNKTWKMQLRN